MAWRLRLAPEKTNIDFFRYAPITFGGSFVAMALSFILVAVMGLNYGIDFRGGTTIRTDSSVAVDVGVYREALAPLGLGDVSIAEVFDPSFRADQHVAMIRIQAQNDTEAVSPETIQQIEDALRAVDPAITFPQVESVGPKVSGELIRTAVLAVIAACAGIGAYIWMRFEWQYGVGAVVALAHDVIVTVGIFALFQLKFDLTIVAALLTILGYSVNDTVVVFDRLRENLLKYKQMPLRDVMNLSVNETLSRTLMTASTVLISLFALLIFGGDVIRGFIFAITFGVFIGTYSSVYVAKNVVLWLGLPKDKPKADKGNQFANIDA